MTSTLTRFVSDDRGTLGKLTIDPLDSQILAQEAPIWTLENPWRDNQRNISCIPTGTYRVTPHESPSKGLCFLLHDVPNRDHVLVHVGNYTKDTEGCILVGSGMNVHLSLIHI